MTHLFTLFLRLAQAENKCKQMGRWQSLLSISDTTYALCIYDLWETLNGLVFHLTSTLTNCTRHEDYISRISGLKKQKY